MPLNECKSHHDTAAPPDYDPSSDPSIPDDENDYSEGYFDPRCPYCHHRATDECSHLVLSGSENSPSIELGPWTTDLLEIESFEAWSPEQVEKALGELAPAFEAYENYGSLGEPDWHVLLQVLMRSVAPEVIERSRDIADRFGFRTDTEFCFFSPDVTTVRAELSTLYERVGKSLVLLSKLPPAFGCRSCHTPFDRASSTKCPACESVHCPFCGTSSHFWRDGGFWIHDEPCAHLIGSYSHDSGDWEVSSPLDDLDLPRLDRPLADGVSDDLIDQIFGDLKDLIEAYESRWMLGQAKGLTEEPDHVLLLEGLVKLIDIPAQVVSWCPQELSMGSMGGLDFFVADPDRFRVEVKWIVARLSTAFRDLSESSPLQRPGHG